MRRGASKSRAGGRERMERQDNALHTGRSKIRGKLDHKATCPVKRFRQGLITSPSCIKLRKHELLRESDDFVSFLPWSWLWTAQGGEPLSVRDLPQIQLRTAQARFQTARIRYLRDLLIRGQTNRVQREGRILAFAVACVLAVSAITIGFHLSHAQRVFRLGIFLQRLLHVCVTEVVAKFHSWLGQPRHFIVIDWHIHVR